MRTDDPFRQLRSPLCERLECNYPILQAGMGGVARSQLVSAVIEAGAYGFLGMVRESPGLMCEEIHRVRSVSSRPFGINLIPAATDPDLLDRQLAVCIKLEVHSVCLFWDVAPSVVKQLKDADITVIYQVGSVEDAVAAWRAGADLLIAQGREAGGHVRGRQSTLTLVPRVVDATPLPVIASGGIADGRAMAASLALGAQGVHCGTLFLATDESNAHDYHKRRIVKAEADDTVYTRRFHINWHEAAPVRVLENSTTRAIPADDQKIIAYENGRAIPLYSTDSPLRETTGALEAMALYAGEGVSQIHDIRPAAERVTGMLAQAKAALKTLSANGPRRDRPDTQDIELASSPCAMAEFGLGGTDEH